MTAMSEARLQKLLVLLFVLALFGMGMSHLREQKMKEQLEISVSNTENNVVQHHVEIKE